MKTTKYPPKDFPDGVNPLDVRDVEYKEMTNATEALAMCFALALNVAEERNLLTNDTVATISRISDELYTGLLKGQFIEHEGPEYRLIDRKKPTSLVIGE
jgi:hypothetical protein